jgi:two-component system, LytTR family, sensor kinase
MTPQHIAALVNLLGFITGAVLYAMLLAMLLRATQTAADDQADSGTVQREDLSTRRFLLASAVLGLLWNLGALVIYGVRDWSIGHLAPWFDAAVFTSLGFLPAVVVHSVLRAGVGRGERSGAWMIVTAAYSLSGCAALLLFYSAIKNGVAPSITALQVLTFGFGALTLALLIYARRSPVWKRALWVVALSVFAVSALHISRHTTGAHPWFIELIGHHASLPLVIAMLYQDFRFALADIFLKRALALVALVSVASGLYVLTTAPLLQMRDANGDLDPRAVGALLGLWMATALIYPWLRRAISWFVDAVVLRRADYQELRDEIALVASSSEETREMLDEVCLRLSRALTANEVRWHEVENVGEAIATARLDSAREFVLPSEVVRLADQEKGAISNSDLRLVSLKRPTATLLIPTHDQPQYVVIIGELSGGRQLLSDDISLLDSVAILLARRIDAIRVTHERCERNLREQEFSKLATEAELRALRAQLNPHFLFNALTTISYLIQTAPERALDTLMRLSGLLRFVLSAPTGGLTTLGEEIDLVESYLAIERARFEERLRVRIDVPEDLRKLQIPPLVLQPLVENAIKHGIAPSSIGGDLTVAARITHAPPHLCISVRDTGVGVSEINFQQGRGCGVGLTNVERRLECVYGQDASLSLTSVPGGGTVAEMLLPLGIEVVAI